MGAEKQAFRARLPPILTLSTRYQTGWNVTKCHTCHGKRHDNLPEPRDETRGSSKTSLPPILTLCSIKIDFFLGVFLGTSEFAISRSNVSCEASVNFQHISQNATLTTESAPCRHLTQPCQCDLQKTRHMTRLKRCACHAKWRWTHPKCCACHKNCNASSENIAKVLRLPHKTIFDTLPNTSECHEVPRLPRETKQRDVLNLQKWRLLENLL